MKFIFCLVLLSLIFAFTANALAQDASSAAESAEKLRTQLREVLAKQDALRLRALQLDEALKPENIEHSLAGIGSTKPEDLREQRRRELTTEKNGVLAQLKILEASQRHLESAIATADARAYQQSVRPSLSDAEIYQQSTRQRSVRRRASDLGISQQGARGAQAQSEREARAYQDGAQQTSSNAESSDAETSKQTGQPTAADSQTSQGTQSTASSTEQMLAAQNASQNAATNRWLLLALTGLIAALMITATIIILRRAAQ